MRTFETWEYEEIELTFGVTRQYQFAPLEAWLATPIEPSAHEQAELRLLQEPLSKFVDDWNEDELKFFFISPVVNLVNFQQERFHPFLQRKLTATIDEIAVGGVVDFMVATGIQHPRHPFFFLHEYKQERKRENDPLGQLLIAMFAAQTKNAQPMPLYGTYIVGRNWFFVVVQERNYAVSLAFDATKDDLFKVFAILQQAKAYITQFVQRTTRDAKSI